MKHISVKIWGNVQGVFFRESAKEQAEKLGLVGFVRNEKDRTIYIEVEGDEPSLLEFAEWCKRGPEGSSVKKIVVQSGTAKGLKGFRVIV